MLLHPENRLYLAKVQTALPVCKIMALKCILLLYEHNSLASVSTKHPNIICSLLRHTVAHSSQGNPFMILDTFNTLLQPITFLPSSVSESSFIQCVEVDNY